MPQAGTRCAKLFEELVEALVEEGVESNDFEIGSMRYAQMELLGHGLGKQLSQRVQEALSQRQFEEMSECYGCPDCGRECPGQKVKKKITSVDGEVGLSEVRCFCKKCRKSFFPST